MVKGTPMNQHQLGALQDLFADSEGRRFVIEFGDGDRQCLQIVDTSHVQLCDTVWGFPVTSSGEPMPAEPGIQFDLADVMRVTDLDTSRLLYP
jgi:hypothetical protein